MKVFKNLLFSNYKTFVLNTVVDKTHQIKCRNSNFRWEHDKRHSTVHSFVDVGRFFEYDRTFPFENRQNLAQICQIKILFVFVFKIS